ncbi:uncharacterized protein EDB91DRAFT_1082898 [Suillus paluster]|uniref:uncharacterized protein n=1 Tax=Suillus paluster TaxID=48578 RepID=UPI001B87339A|nr:uncharacterized protein EDB91DRAFT_1082898 [Suillus paluster]KAG1738144.1 hypothetical protein EDB91DRAFT_1082898 [Suillus paluster]
MTADACFFDPMLPGFFSFSGTQRCALSQLFYLSTYIFKLFYTAYLIYVMVQCPPAGIDALKQQLSLFTYLQTPKLHGTAYELLPSNKLQEIAAPFLNLPWLNGRMGNNKMMYSVYNYVGVAWDNEPLTIVHLAQFPLGYQHNDESMDDLESILQTTWIESSAMTSAPEVAQPVRSKKVKAAHSLHRIMEACPNWCKALAYLRVFLRMLICCGHSNNPHLLTNTNYAEHRFKLICNIWPQCLEHAKITSDDLETVEPMDYVVPLQHPLGDQLLHEQRLHLWAQQLLWLDSKAQHWDPPTDANGFYAFLTHQAAKEMIFHIVFRTTATNRVHLTIADLEPATFRHAAHLPVDTLALVGLCLMSIWGIADVMPQYPAVSQVYGELHETVMMLLQQHQDPDIAVFMAHMRVLCNIT